MLLAYANAEQPSHLRIAAVFQNLVSAAVLTVFIVKYTLFLNKKCFAIFSLWKHLHKCELDCHLAIIKEFLRFLPFFSQISAHI